MVFVCKLSNFHLIYQRLKRLHGYRTYQLHVSRMRPPKPLLTSSIVIISRAVIRARRTTLLSTTTNVMDALAVHYLSTETSEIEVRNVFTESGACGTISGTNGVSLRLASLTCGVATATNGRDNVSCGRSWSDGGADGDSSARAGGRETGGSSHGRSAGFADIAG